MANCRQHPGPPNQTNHRPVASTTGRSLILCAIIRRTASGIDVSGVTVTTGVIITSAAVRPRAVTSSPSGRLPPPIQSTSARNPPVLRWADLQCGGTLFRQAAMASSFHDHCLPSHRVGQARLVLPYSLHRLGDRILMQID
jgi:hypothetical protein